MSEKPVSPNSHWSYPAVQGAGFVWFGERTAQPGDYEALDELVGEGTSEHVQEHSCLGRHHPGWISQWYANTSPSQRPGGKGSRPYENQWCGAGVQFTKERIWHINKFGKMVKEVPANCGAYHRRFDGDGWTNYHGPEPGSEAAQLLNRRAYHWDDVNEWYYPGPDAPDPWW